MKSTERRRAHNLRRAHDTAHSVSLLLFILDSKDSEYTAWFSVGLRGWLGAEGRGKTEKGLMGVI